jgi:hypothetical protein
MPFWDRFALWVYLGLADLHPVGRDAVVRLFGHAYSAECLNLTHSNPITLLLIAGVCPPESAVRVTAEAQLIHRRLNTEYDLVRGIQRSLAGPRVTEILEVNRPHRAVMAQLLTGVLMNHPGNEVWTNLTEYLSRIDQAAPDVVRARVTNRIIGAVQRYYRFPIGTIDFMGLLYRHANGYLGIGQVSLPVYESGSARLDEIEDGEEQAFLVRCGVRLSDADRVLLFMHFYGRLTVEQIAASLRLADPTWTADLVASEIERCWIAVL